jgi:hypothetical protein
MTYAVEVRLIGGDWVASMTRMRTWLDHNRFEPDAFRHSAGGAGVTFRLEFKAETEACAFAKAFDGRVLGSPSPVVGAALWPATASAK